MRLLRMAIRTALAVVTILALVEVVPIDASSDRRIRLRDDCDPVTFAFAAGGCVGDGDTTFGEFIAELTKKQTVGAWRFSPDETEVKVGEILTAVNRGGEVHTFTKVVAFGGGFVPPLNTLSGNPITAPECLPPFNVASNPLGAAGGSIGAPFNTFPNTVTLATGPGTPLPVGVNRFQCCIHPWMRTTVGVEDP